MDQFYPPNRYDIPIKTRSNLLPWTGQFSPQLVEALLQEFGTNAEIVFDPFMGSGTTLVEASSRGHTAWGSDLTFAAVLLARTYEFINVETSLREDVMYRVEANILRLVNTSEDTWWSDKTDPMMKHQSDIESMMSLCRSAEDELEHRLLTTLIILSSEQYKGQKPKEVYATWQKLVKIIRNLPYTDKPIDIKQADARRLPFPNDRVELIITSPPYINVQNYHQQFRPIVEGLGEVVLPLAASEIGSNRQNRSNRFQTIVQYSLDMSLAIREMLRVSKRGSNIINVVGAHTTVLGVPISNGDLVADIAKHVGLNVTFHSERGFINRYGKKIREVILQFKATDALPDESVFLWEGRRAAKKHLENIPNGLSPENKLLLQTTLTRIDDIMPSPYVDNLITSTVH